MNKQTENYKEKNNKSVITIIVILGVAFFVGSIVLVLALMGIFSDKKAKEENSMKYELTSSFFTESNSDEELTDSYNIIDSFGTTETQIAYEQESEEQKSTALNVAPTKTVNSSHSERDETTVLGTTKNAAIEYYEQLSPKGNNMLSDNCDNQFIKLVSETYDVDSDLLVAVYAVPDNGDNFVLQFNGKKDSSGNYIKSPDTLSKIYQIDKSKNVKIATGKTTGNVGVSYGESVLCFNIVKTIIMEQYPDYFTGLED